MTDADSFASRCRRRLRVLLAAVACAVPGLLLGCTSGGSAKEARSDGNPPTEHGSAGAANRVVGSSVEGRELRALEFGPGPETTLVFCGFHGDERPAERVGTALVRRLAEAEREGLLAGRRVVVVPAVNPDGRAAGRRTNARHVDLNRNFPTRDWGAGRVNTRYEAGPYPGSEPETQAVMALVERYRPARILSIHSPLRMNNYDGPAGEGLARAMAAQNGYPVRSSIGYPTPGSFGTWAGLERGLPMVTLEVERGAAGTEKNVAAVLAAIRLRP
ncbi:MAG: DUF2817 domain-containing protein [Planctomycetes bacterium]|nr:DUF2817 domain-containing protein [Planctomycetota bacterium]